MLQEFFFVSFFVDRTNGHTYATMSLPSIICLSVVCSVCIVAELAS